MSESTRYAAAIYLNNSNRLAEPSEDILARFDDMDAQIASLRHSAECAGDSEGVALCDKALGGDAEAIEDCSDMI